MGDRGNINVVDNGKSVYLYTYWKGTDIPTVVKRPYQRHILR